MVFLNHLKKLNTYYATLKNVHGTEIIPSKLRLYCDFFFSLAIYGSTISDFFQYRFWEKSRLARKQFMTARKNNEFYNQVNTRQARSWLNHKAVFNKNFAPYLKRETMAIPGASLEEFDTFCKNQGSFFVKPCKTGAGEGVKKYSYKDLPDIAALYYELLSGEYVVEECIVQDEAMASIHPQSINTVRTITFFNGREVTVIGAVLRCGAGGSYIDNHSAGGYTAIVDVESGIVITCASNKWRLNVVKHPDTGVMFPGFQIPNWDKAVSMVKEAAGSLEGIHYAGWDVAFIPGDVCLVEANPSGDPVVLQEPTQRGVKHLYDWMLSELNRNK